MINRIAGLQTEWIGDKESGVAKFVGVAREKNPQEIAQAKEIDVRIRTAKEQLVEEDREIVEKILELVDVGTVDLGKDDWRTVASQALEVKQSKLEAALNNFKRNLLAQKTGEEQTTSSDRAMVGNSQDELGGIDFNPNGMTWDVESQPGSNPNNKGFGRINVQATDQIPSGLVPIILDIKPIQNWNLILSSAGSDLN